MTSYIENETNVEFDFPIKEVADSVILQILDSENCPYEATVNILITDNEGIRQYNADYRGIDKETDVLSFPNVDYETPSDFSNLEDSIADYFDPDTDELILRDIILSVDRIKQQAIEYGHSQKREYAFLIAHSMLHLCGYDHMEEEEAAIMEAKQKEALDTLGITRDI